MLMEPKLTREELDNRMTRLRQRLEKSCPDWRVAAVTEKVSLYYLTGTMPSGVLWIDRDRGNILFIRKGYERALEESPFADIRKFRSFRDIASTVEISSESIYVEKSSMPMGFFEFFNNYFGFKRAEALDPHLTAIRAVKSDFELSRIRQAGRIHQLVLEELLPDMLQEGISEAELGSSLLKTLIDKGADGIARFSMHGSEFLLGYLGFSESNLMPTNFDGPDGNTGLNPAAPFMGSRRRELRKGDTVFVDIGCGFEGYYTDKTSVYSFGEQQPKEVVDIHNRCVEIMTVAADMLKPGNIPSQIYTDILESLDEDFKVNFMGVGESAVRFLGHSVGLHIDEPPAIAKGFDEPLEESMVIALEPKKAIEGIGMVGIENTFLVTAGGGESLTGNLWDIINV